MDSGNAIIILGKQNIYPCYFTQVLSFVNEVKTIIPFPRSDDFTNTLLCVLSHSRILKIMQTEMKKPDYQIIRRFISSESEGYLLKSILENVPEEIRLLGFLKS